MAVCAMFITDLLREPYGNRGQTMQLQATSPFGSASAQRTFEQIEQTFGGLVPQLFQLLESQPSLLTHIWGQYQALILQGDLPRVLKEMVGLIVAHATHCDYVGTIHLHSLRHQNVEPMTLAAVARGNFAAAEISHATFAVLRFTSLAIVNRTTSSRLTTSQRQTLYQETTQALDDTGLEANEQLELIATIGLFEQLCTVANLLQLAPERL